MNILRTANECGQRVYDIICTRRDRMNPANQFIEGTVENQYCNLFTNCVKTTCIISNFVFMNLVFYNKLTVEEENRELGTIDHICNSLLYTGMALSPLIAYGVVKQISYFTSLDRGLIQNEQRVADLESYRDEYLSDYRLAIDLSKQNTKFDNFQSKIKNAKSIVIADEENNSFEI